MRGFIVPASFIAPNARREGFRRITYYLDRPDVLSVFTTRIEAERRKRRSCSPTATRSSAGDLANGRHFAVWRDPFPKPCYLFAVVGGDLDAMQDEFTTASGRKVALGIYVEKDKMHRAHYAMEWLIHAMRWDEFVYRPRI